ncbi:hypothetical protein FM019_05380 [Aliiglaciecola sp. M165]|nr:hypothetical protein FM019_05380 [Aliiglaciecola sp. M165]
MKFRILFITCFLFLQFELSAAEDVLNKQVSNVYQLDSDATTFEMRIEGPNSCGGVYWRVKSPNEAVANRKFSLVLTALTTKSPLSFHDIGVCEGDRSIVSWIRLSN